MRFIITAFLLTVSVAIAAQTIKGRVIDGSTGEPVFAAVVGEKGTANGTTTDFDGDFTLKVKGLPAVVVINYIGYNAAEYTFTSEEKATIKLEPKIDDTKAVIITDDRILQKQKQNPLTVESMDQIAIKEAPTGSFYESLGALKGVDMTTASLGFRIINTRGFNSTAPVRMLQLIDGVDNQSPGLNFSLGNFLGASDLDVKSVEVVQGASSAFFGPGAFNGVVNMETKNPFLTPGLTATLKVGERNLVEPAVRWADVFNNKSGKPWLAYKLNLYYLRALDWEADNYEPIFNARNGANNPGRFDAVNIYGDEYFSGNDFSGAAPWTRASRGLGTFYRTGYREADLLDYSTNNLKASAAFHFRLKPEEDYNSTEFIVASSVGTGTTVFQGENRFRLRDIFFIQNRMELKKKDDFFVRMYMTYEDAGRSYDPYATALRLQQEARSNTDWARAYSRLWNDSIQPVIDGLGYPGLEINPDWNPADPNSPFYLPYDSDSLNSWLSVYNDSLFAWHNQVANWANTSSGGIVSLDPTGYYTPGSDQFNEAFDRITSLKNNEGEGGTRFFDRSSLYHLDAQKTFLNQWGIDIIRVGVSGRLYTPRTDGTIFSDTAGTRITNMQTGYYAGAEHKLMEDKLILTASVRADKNENFPWLISPAASAVYTPKKNHYARLTYSSGLRNPTLSDQFLSLNVGPAILSGNLNGADSLVTVPSFFAYRSALIRDSLRYFNIDPIRPEQVRTLEVGYRASIRNKVFVDASYYSSWFEHFIGFKVGLDIDFEPGTSFPRNVQAYRYAANATTTVRTQGFSIGANYFLGDHWTVGANYSWNELVKKDANDPVIPAFNTPRNKYNVSLNLRDKKLFPKSENTFGAGINYKWIQGFLFEGSPQFTGFVDSYSLVDAQINYLLKKQNVTFKLGCSNLLNNLQIQTYGGPRIGRLAYFSITYDFQKKQP